MDLNETIYSGCFTYCVRRPTFEEVQSFQSYWQTAKYSNKAKKKNSSNKKSRVLQTALSSITLETGVKSLVRCCVNRIGYYTRYKLAFFLWKVYAIRSQNESIFEFPCKSFYINVDLKLDNQWSDQFARNHVFSQI